VSTFFLSLVSRACGAVVWRFWFRCWREPLTVIVVSSPSLFPESPPIPPKVSGIALSVVGLRLNVFSIVVPVPLFAHWCDMRGPPFLSSKRAVCRGSLSPLLYRCRSPLPLTFCGFPMLSLWKHWLFPQCVRSFFCVETRPQVYCGPFY